ncbi:MAG: hypothetical protein AAGA92_13450, partial [Planctomycetota bacterium]
GDERLDVNSGATLIGYGTIDLEDSVASNGSRFTLSGATLSVGNTTDGLLIFTDVARTLTINATDPDTTADLDQGGSTVNLLASGTLDLNIPIVPASDPAFSSTMNLARKSTLDVQDAWGFNGTMNVNTVPGLFAGQFAGPATITGGTISQTGGTINLDNANDHLIFNTSYQGTGGTISLQNGAITFNASSTIGAGVDFDMSSNSADSTEVNIGPGAIVTVNDDDWDWDGAGAADNVINIASDGRLNANLTSSADRYGGTMNIDGGILSVQNLNNIWGQDDGTITITGDGTPATTSSFFGDAFAKSGGTLDVEAGGTLVMSVATVFSGGVINVDGEAFSSGTLTTWAGATLTGSGIFRQNADATVTANQTMDVATFDMDGTAGSAIDITIQPGNTLTINSTAIDDSGGFNGNLNVNSATLEVNTANWELGNLGDINLANTIVSGATIAEGGTLTVQSGANITTTGFDHVIATDVVLEEGANLTVNAALPNLTGDVVIGDGASTFTLAGGDITGGVGESTVTNEGLSVTGTSAIAVTTLDWDQGETTIESGGDLTINVTSIDLGGNNQYDSTLNINGGAVSVDNAANVWQMDGTTNFDGGGTLAGDDVQFGDDLGAADANLNVAGAGVAAISAAAAYLSDADVFIDAGATLRNSGVTTFAPAGGGNNGEFTGTGTWQLGGTNNIEEATTIDMVGGTVDLDNSFEPPFPAFANDTNINADLTINAATMADYGNQGFFITLNLSDMVIADGATLTVNLDNPNDEWTVNSVGRVTYNGDATADTFLAGSDVNMDGVLTVNGDGRSTARLDIGGTVNVNTAGEGLTLDGGDQAADPNTIAGGTINGPGAIRAEFNRTLRGFGTINADIDFGIGGDLRADDGTLTINGAILSGRRLGPVDNDGVLNITNPWNTSSVNSVTLDGGELTGATITHDGFGGINDITGFGTISAPIINNNEIRAAGNGTLRLTNITSDWDGAAGNGVLSANGGNLELVDAGSFGFAGTVNVSNGREFFVNGFNLDFDPGSTLNMTGGTLRAVSTQTFGGAVNVDNNPAMWDTGAVIQSTAVVTVSSELRLDGDTQVQAGATFSGAGAIVNEIGSNLILLDGADIDILLENEGTLELGPSLGQTTGLDFQQNSSGTWQLDIEGIGLNDFDRMNLTGLALLDGTLDLTLLAGFQPDIGDTFNILSASGGVGGAFADVLQPNTLADGRVFQVNYLPTIVRLEVVADLNADFDDDNDVDVADLMILQRGFGVGNTQAEGDADFDGDIDAADLAVWEGQFGAGSAVSATLAATTVVPEPTTALMPVVGLAFAAGLRRG